MIKQDKISTEIIEAIEEINYDDAYKIFMKIHSFYREKFLLESKDISNIYGRLSLIGIEPIIKISAKENDFKIECLHKRGKKYLQKLTTKDLKICDQLKIDQNKISGKINKENRSIEETERSKQKNISQIIRIFLQKFKIKKKTNLGLYGAFSYDFIRLFEDIGNNLPENEINDFTLFFYDTFIFFDHLKEKTEIITFRENEKENKSAIQNIIKQIKNSKIKKEKYQISNSKFSLSKKDFEKLVKIAQQYTKIGDQFEVVFSNILKAKFKGSAAALYGQYREINPSPYLFYFDFGYEQLVGASPEMMVRCEHRTVHLRPISGTAKRGKDPIEDHENMLALLSDPKEKAELDMLIDLGRNDLSRVCEPGISVSDYRFVEKYSRVMHTVTHLSGKLRKEYTALDSLISCINAGTLTGAPKVAAMQTIEKHEKERRGYYGGTIGYLTLNGDMDSGIIIRTAHIRNEELKFQVGATLLHDSIPTKEYEETINKASAFLKTISS